MVPPFVKNSGNIDVRWEQMVYKYSGIVPRPALLHIKSPAGSDG